MWNQLRKSPPMTSLRVVKEGSSACDRTCLAGRSRALRIGCILSEPGAPKDEGIPRDEGLLGLQGGVGAYCTIRTSNVKALKAGSKIFYVQPSRVRRTLDSDIVIYVKHGTAATGHCLLHLASGIGLCTISDGTGTLAGFHLRVRVTADTSTQNLWHWDGTYSFGKG